MFKLIKESVVDIPRRTYARDIFDDADTENPKLKPIVLDVINNQLKEFEKLYPIKSYSLVGSSITKQYRNDADLDVNVLFDVAPEDREAVRLMLSHKLKDVNGKLIPGTQHPVNYYIITEPKVKETNDDMADGVFDIKNNTWERKPKIYVFDPENYAKEFDKKVKEIDALEGELKRDIVDYEDLKELSTNDVLNLQDIINTRIEKIEDDMKNIVHFGDDVVKARRDAFAKDMTPDEIRKFGKKNLLPKNVIYKLLEKYHYLRLYHHLKEILHDDHITDDEIRSIQTENKEDDTIMMYKLTGKAMKAMPGSIIQKEIIKQLNVYRKKLSMEPITMHKDKPITEAIARTTAFTFGRFNPPTIGHEKLIQKVASQPTNDYHIYVSRSVDSSKNPLSLTNKISFLKKMFPKFANKIEPNPSNMILDLATNLYNKGYTSITMVVGSDRVREFETMLKKYNDVHSRHGYYNFKTINVVSAGERDPDEEGATGISASKLRTYAHNGDFKSFEKGVPNTLTKKEKQSLFNSVRKGMNLKELDESDWDAYGGYDLKPIASLEQFEIQQIRDLYIREMIFNIGEQVHNVHLEVKGKVVRRGTNYVVLEDTNNNLHKSWIWDCVPITANRDVEIREIDLNVDYGFKAVSEIKEQPKLIEEKKKKIFNELKKELVNMNNEKKEGYDIGHDWAQHNAKMTPGEPQYDPNYLSKPSTPEENMYKPSKPIENITQISTQEIEDWSYAKDTIDKYRERYGDNYKSKIDEVKKKMMSFKDYKKDKK